MKKNQLLICMLSLLVMVNFQCKNPIEELKAFKVNLNGKLADPLVKIKFKTNDALNEEAKNVSVSITGQDAKYIFDGNGYYNFTVQNGVIDIILDPNANPTNENPIVFSVEAFAENCVPIRQDVYIFSKTNKFDVTLTFKSNNNLPNNVTFKTENLNFLGKKAIDTVKFDLTRFDGVKFVVKYPTTGLSFIKRTNKKFKIGEKIRLEAETRDTAVLVLDTIKEDIKEIIGVQIYNGQVVNDYKITGFKLIPQSNTVIKKVFVGYRVLDTVPIYESRIVIDTVPFSNVKASIYSQSDFMEEGFFDENGDYIDKPRQFNGVIGIPQVYLYENNNYASSIIPVYSNANGARIIECYLPSKTNYKLFCSGVALSTKGDYYYNVKRSVPLNEIKDFKLDTGGFYKFAFNDKLIDGTYFIYQNSEIGCGFVSVNVAFPNLKLDYGFEAYVSVSGKYGSYGFYLSSYNYTIRIPVFNGSYSINTYINHPDNRCARNPALFDNTEQVNLCNFVNSNTPYNYIVPYNGDDYIKTLPPFLPLKLTAKIQCSGGNFVTPPDITLLYKKIGCVGTDLYSEITLKDGKINTSAFQKDQTYQIRYDRISESGTKYIILDTISFNSSKPIQTVKDDATEYWVGTMKYLVNSFEIDLVFDNKKLKYNINGCGD